MVVGPGLGWLLTDGTEQTCRVDWGKCARCISIVHVSSMSISFRRLGPSTRSMMHDPSIVVPPMHRPACCGGDQRRRSGRCCLGRAGSAASAVIGPFLGVGAGDYTMALVHVSVPGPFRAVVAAHCLHLHGHTGIHLLCSVVYVPHLTAERGTAGWVVNERVEWRTGTGRESHE